MNIFRLIGDLLHLASIFIVLFKMLSKKTCGGLSLKSQILYAVVFTTRYLDLFFTFISWYNTLMKIFFIASTYHIIFLMQKRFRASYDKQNDSFRIRFLLIPAAILALVFNRAFRPLDILWAFSEWLEAVAILPQLFLLQRSGGAEILTYHYLVCLGGYRVFYILNWIYRFVVEGKVQWIQWIAGTTQSLLYVDFFHHYFVRVIKQGKLALPS